MTTPISIEFFPPQTPEGLDKLRSTRAELAKLKPEFFSVTYGAGGSTRERTFAVVKEIAAEGFDAAPHLSCIGSTRESIREILNEYKAAGIKRTVALRGDLPSGMAETGEFRYANELVEFIRAETGDWFSIEVAAYFHFVDQAKALGVDVPIVPGIMPIVGFTKLARFSDACGAELPRWMRKKFESFGDDTDSIRAFGLDVVTELCERLLKGGAPGLHFYCMNQAGLTTEICKRLGIA